MIPAKALISLARKLNMNPNRAIKAVDNIVASGSAEKHPILKNHFLGKYDEALPSDKLANTEYFDNAFVFTEEAIPKDINQVISQAKEMVREHFKTKESFKRFLKTSDIEDKNWPLSEKRRESMQMATQGVKWDKDGINVIALTQKEKDILAGKGFNKEFWAEQGFATRMDEYFSPEAYKASEYPGKQADKFREAFKDYKNYIDKTLDRTEPFLFIQSKAKSAEKPIYGIQGFRSYKGGESGLRIPKTKVGLEYKRTQNIKTPSDLRKELSKLRKESEGVNTVSDILNLQLKEKDLKGPFETALHEYVHAVQKSVNKWQPSKKWDSNPRLSRKKSPFRNNPVSDSMSRGGNFDEFLLRNRKKNVKLNERSKYLLYWKETMARINALRIMKKKFPKADIKVSKQYKNLLEVYTPEFIDKLMKNYWALIPGVPMVDRLKEMNNE